MKLLFPLSVTLVLQLPLCSSFNILGLTPLPALLGRMITTGVVSSEDIIQEQYKPDPQDYGAYPDGAVMTPVLIARKFPGLKFSPAIMSDLSPPSERKSSIKRKLLRLGLSVKRKLSPGFAYTKPWTQEGVHYPDWCKDLSDGMEPERPEDLNMEDQIAGMAHRGPFSVYFQYDNHSDEYVLDLSVLESAEPREPFVAAGGVARVVKDGESFRTSEVSFRGDVSRPGEKNWELFQKRFLVGLNTYATALDHLTHMHIIGAGTFSICTISTLPPEHPLRILLQPFVIETNTVNNNNINGLIQTEQDNVPSYTGYKLDTINSLMRNTTMNFDISYLDPEQRFQKYGQRQDLKSFPTVESLLEIFGMFKKFTNGWVDQHVENVDEATRNWVRELDNHIPNGVLGLVGISSTDELTTKHVAHIAATFMFTASVWHHVVADMTSDYFMQFDAMPPSMNSDGHTTFGVMLEKRNSILVAALLRYKLVSEIDYYEDESMKELWNGFQSDLKGYSSTLDSKGESRHYYIDPRVVPSSIHA